MSPFSSRNWLPGKAGETLVADAARILTELRLCEVTEERLLASLAASTDAARYWQEPDGTDLLAATAPMREPLSRVAEHISAAPKPTWWNAPASADQYSILWDGEPDPASTPSPDVLRNDRDIQATTETATNSDPRAARIPDGAGPSGEWRSTPPNGIISSTPASDTHGPIGLWCTEDNLDRVHAHAYWLEVPGAARVYRIDSAASWAGLCARFPRDLTGTRRHDWHRATHVWMTSPVDRTRRWVMPEWTDVAEHYDAIQLQLNAYLATAGTAIPVRADATTVLAGWIPAATYWFTPQTRRTGVPESWELRDRDTEMRWERSTETR